jgi:hypothetical protein
MTVKAELLSCFGQQLFRIAGMRGVAGGTAALGFHGPVDAFRGGQPFFDCLMAGEAEIRPGRGKELFRLRAVGIVAGRAAVCQGGVPEFPLYFAFHIDMAHEAQVRSVPDQQVVELRFMGIVAGRAVAGGCRTVKVPEFHLVGMAGGTEVLEGPGEQLRFC